MKICILGNASLRAKDGAANLHFGLNFVSFEYLK